MQLNDTASVFIIKILREDKERVINVNQDSLPFHV